MGRGRRRVASALDRTWFSGASAALLVTAAAAAATRIGVAEARQQRSAAQRTQPSPSERADPGGRNPGVAMVEAAPAGSGPLRRTFLVPEIKSLDQYDFSRAKAAASLAWVLRAAFGGAGNPRAFGEGTGGARLGRGRCGGRGAKPGPWEQ